MVTAGFNSGPDEVAGVLEMAGDGWRSLCELGDG